MKPPRPATLIAAALLATGCVADVELTRAPLAAGGDAATQDVVTTSWRAVPSGISDDLAAIHGIVGGDVWMVGANGRVLRWNGTALQVVPTRTTADLTGVRVVGPREVWVVGTQMNVDGVVLLWDGTDWRDLSPTPRGPTPLRAIWTAPPDEVWAVGGDIGTLEPGIWHRTAGAWRPEMGPQPRPVPWSAVQGDRNGDLWLIGDGAVVWRRTAGGWSAAPMPGGRPSPETLPTRGLCLSGDTLWYTTPGAAVRVTGPSVGMFPAAAAMRGLWCDPSGEVWAVGVAGRVGRFRAGAWALETVTDADLRAVWSAPDGTRWAVGDQGTVFRRVP